MKTTLALLFAVVTVAAMAGCTADDAAVPAEENMGTAPAGATAEVAAGGVVTPTVAPTVVRRMAPPPTPTVDPAKEPLAPVPVENVPGVVVPAAAVLVELAPADDDEAARADFTIEGYDADEISAWLQEQLGELGWELEDERDGALVFVHAADLSATFAEEGLKRGLSVFFDTVEDAAPEAVSFSLVVEPALESGGD